jgi:hypothetical protein
VRAENGLSLFDLFFTHLAALNPAFKTLILHLRWHYYNLGFHIFESSNVLRFSAQALNASPNLNPTQARFGTSYGLSNQANDPRRLQFELRFQIELGSMNTYVAQAVLALGAASLQRTQRSHEIASS